MMMTLSILKSKLLIRVPKRAKAKAKPKIRTSLLLLSTFLNMSDRLYLL